MENAEDKAIDVDLFLNLNEQDTKEILKDFPLGMQLKFWKKYSEWKKNNIETDIEKNIFFGKDETMSHILHALDTLSNTNKLHEQPSTSKDFVFNTCDSNNINLNSLSDLENEEQNQQTRKRYIEQQEFRKRITKSKNKRKTY
ncbi:hypothetical protein PUN28_013965 [Cardiocondyla obscurior]|uniref:Uncharacterized protein n=1 Tax=Cardiocondyla obscurior TaxID=286306 RepID=A0AAW2F854_9HYME